MKGSNILLSINDLKKHFYLQRGSILKAVDGVTLDVCKGETLGLVGESGCGKSTLGRTVLGMYEPTYGEVLFDGKNVHDMNKKELFSFTKRAQIIFQNPYASLDPRMTVENIIGEGIDIHRLYSGEKRLERIYELLRLVGMDREHAGRLPHEFSGGQRQRVGIARALAVEPQFIVCDEPISQLDVSTQAQIVNLLKNLQKKLGLTYLFIAHNLNMVRYICNRVAVMYLGTVVEISQSINIYDNPLHPYTQALLSAIPAPDPEKSRKRIILAGELPSPISLPRGCPFHSRCPEAMDRCRESRPQLKEIEPEHSAACHLY